MLLTEICFHFDSWRIREVGSVDVKSTFLMFWLWVALKLKPTDCLKWNRYLNYNKNYSMCYSFEAHVGFVGKCFCWRLQSSAGSSSNGVRQLQFCLIYLNDPSWWCHHSWRMDSVCIYSSNYFGVAVALILSAQLRLYRRFAYLFNNLNYF